MQAYHVELLDLEGGSDDDDNEYLGGEMPEITDKEYASIDKIKEDLLRFKTNLYNTKVGNAKGNPEDLGALTSFQVLFLDCNAYLMRVLNGQTDTLPELPELSENAKEFNTIVSNIKQILQNPNTSVLVYDILSKINSMPISFLNSKT